MEDIKLIKLALHHLDVTTKEPKKIDIKLKEDTIINYANNPIDEMLENPNKRKYLFKDGETQVKSSIKHIVNNSIECEKALLNNAKRLLEKENEADKFIKRMGKKVQRGSLMHIHFTQNGNHRVLICKVDHDEIINEKSFEINSGLNTKKKIFKAFLIYVKSKTKKEEIYLNDKNNSKYWWSNFLELDQVKTDDENTEKSLNKITSIVDREKRKDGFSLDGTILRNGIIGYYRKNKNFNFTDLYDSVFKGYTPYNKNFPIDKIITKLNKLDGDLSFDKQFSIVQKKIDKKIVSKIKLGTGIYLNIEDFVKNLDKIIKPYSQFGEFGMTIISNQAFNFVKQINGTKDK